MVNSDAKGTYRKNNQKGLLNNERKQKINEAEDWKTDKESKTVKDFTEDYEISAKKFLNNPKNKLSLKNRIGIVEDHFLRDEVKKDGKFKQILRIAVQKEMSARRAVEI